MVKEVHLSLPIAINQNILEMKYALARVLPKRAADVLPGWLKFHSDIIR
jgi:hypothetical protein